MMQQPINELAGPSQIAIFYHHPWLFKLQGAGVLNKAFILFFVGSVYWTGCISF
jgi:hypothetical protein